MVARSRDGREKANRRADNVITSSSLVNQSTPQRERERERADSQSSFVSVVEVEDMMMERFFRLVENHDVAVTSSLPRHRIERRTPGNATEITPPRRPMTVDDDDDTATTTTSSSSAELRVVRRHVLFGKCLRKFPQIWVRKDARLVLTLEESVRVGLPPLTSASVASGEEGSLVARPPQKVGASPETLTDKQLKALDEFVANDDGDLVRGANGNFSFSSREIEVWEQSVVVMTSDERVNFILTPNDLEELKELDEIKRMMDGERARDEDEAETTPREGKFRGRVNSKELRRQRNQRRELAHTSAFLFRASIELIEEKNRVLDGHLEGLRRRYPDVFPARNEIVCFGKLRKISSYRFGMNTSKMKAVVLTFGRMFVMDEDGSKLKILTFPPDSIRVVAEEPSTEGRDDGDYAFHLHINPTAISGGNNATGNVINGGPFATTHTSSSSSTSATHPHHSRSHSGEVFVPYSRNLGASAMLASKSSQESSSSMNSTTTPMTSEAIGGGGLFLTLTDFGLSANASSVSNTANHNTNNNGAFAVIKTFCAESEEERRKWVECLELVAGIPNHQSFELRNSLNLCRTLQTKALTHLASDAPSPSGAQEIERAMSPKGGSSSTNNKKKTGESNSATGASYLTFLRDELPKHSPLVVPLDWVQRELCRPRGEFDSSFNQVGKDFQRDRAKVDGTLISGGEGEGTKTLLRLVHTISRSLLSRLRVHPISAISTTTARRTDSVSSCEEDERDDDDDNTTRGRDATREDDDDRRDRRTIEMDASDEDEEESANDLQVPPTTRHPRQSVRDMDLLMAVHTLLLCSTRTQVGGLAFEALNLILTGSNANNGSPEITTTSSKISSSSSSSATVPLPAHSTSPGARFFAENFALVPLMRSAGGGEQGESPIEIDFERYRAPRRRLSATSNNNNNNLSSSAGGVPSTNSSTKTTPAPTPTRIPNTTSDGDASLPLAPGLLAGSSLVTTTTPVASSTTTATTTTTRNRHRRTASDPWSYIKAHTPGVLLSSLPHTSATGSGLAASEKKAAPIAPPPLQITHNGSDESDQFLRREEGGDDVPSHLDSVKVIVRTKMAFALWDTSSTSATPSPVVIFRTVFAREFYFVRAVSKLVAAGSGTLTVSVERT